MGPIAKEIETRIIVLSDQNTKWDRGPYLGNHSCAIYDGDKKAVSEITQDYIDNYLTDVSLADTGEITWPYDPPLYGRRRITSWNDIQPNRRSVIDMLQMVLLAAIDDGV